MLEQWAIRNRVSHKALTELRELFGISVSRPLVENEHSETYVQSLVRLNAGRLGYKLWRNNVGVLRNENGIPVRYGLANDTARLNETVKSADLIGWRPVDVGGVKIAQFVSFECKRPDWVYTGTAHERAQLKWAEAISADGGHAKFVTNGDVL